MKKLILVIAAVGLIAILAACRSTTPAPTPEATSTPTATAAPSEESTEAVAEATAAFPTPNPSPECVAEPIPEDPNIPPPTADDWSKGSPDAVVTLIEYGDFQ
ncbi:MAG: hypothetical protein Kow0063_19400 [Anaerolineae bacterium]